jgi:hypothetical protein
VSDAICWMQKIRLGRRVHSISASCWRIRVVGEECPLKPCTTTKKGGQRRPRQPATITHRSCYHQKKESGDGGGCQRLGGFGKKSNPAAARRLLLGSSPKRLKMTIVSVLKSGPETQEPCHQNSLLLHRRYQIGKRVHRVFHENQDIFT